MKKILLVLLLVPCLAFGAAKTWLGTTSSAKTAANWVGGALPSNNIDTAIFATANNNACDIDSGFSLYKIRTEAGYTSTITVKTGNTLTTRDFVLAGNCTFTVELNGTWTHLPDASRPAWSIAAGATVNGGSSMQTRPDGNGVIITCPAYTNTLGNGMLFNQSPARTNTGVIFTGNQSYTGNFTQYNSRSGTVITYKYGSYTFYCGVKWSINVSTGATAYDSLKSSTHNIVGDVDLAGAGTLYMAPGTSLFNLIGTAAQVVTFGTGGKLYDLTITNTGSDIATPVSFADSATLTGDLTLTDGPVVMTGIGIRAVDYTYTSADSVRSGRLWLTGNYTRAAGASKCDTSGQHIRFLAGTSHTMAAANKVYAKVTANAPLTINGGATIALLSYGVDGIPVIIETATTLTVGSIAGIGGTAEAPDTLQGAGAGATLDLTGNQTVTWTYTAIGGMALAAGDTVVVSDGTSINLGGNTGAWIWPTVTSRIGGPGGTRRSTGVDLIIGP